jgi:hypothetical protein
MEQIVTHNIKKALSYGEKLVGKPYGKWTSSDNMVDVDEPYFAYDTKAPSPSKIKSASCGGFINLLRRSLDLNIPGKGDYKGGTQQWFYVLNKKKLLEKIDLKKSYPVGTLLIRNYKDVLDQGHVAVVYSQGLTLKTSSIIHSYYKGILIDDNLKTFGDKKGYYSHVCYPEKWLVNKL